MRRKDKEQDRAFGLAVIDRSPFGTLCISDDGQVPCAVPLSLARAGDVLYFHSAQQGEKCDLLCREPRVKMVFACDVQVPAPYTEKRLDKALQEGDTALLQSVFTTGYSSAIVVGRVKKLRGNAQKMEGLRVICQRFTPQYMAYFEAAAAGWLERADVYAIEIESITAKAEKVQPSCGGG